MPGNDTTFLYCESIGQEDAIAAAPHDECYADELSDCEEKATSAHTSEAPSESSRVDLLKVSTPLKVIIDDAEPANHPKYLMSVSETLQTPVKPCPSLSVLKEGSPAPIPFQVSVNVQEVPHFNNGLTDDYMTRHPWVPSLILTSQGTL
eukprot:5206123-Amphidinium_carterae.1